jgi:hypothetical protein
MCVAGVGEYSRLVGLVPRFHQYMLARTVGANGHKIANEIHLLRSNSIGSSV